MLGACGTDIRPGGGDDGNGDDGGGDDGFGPDGGVSGSGSDSSTTPPPSPGFMLCGPDLCIDLAATANAALRSVGGQRVITVSGKRYLVIRETADAFIALSAACTHTGCTVSYAKARNDVVCPCHGSTFALTGAVTHGPAALPLKRYETSFDAASEVLTVVLAA